MNYILYHWSKYNKYFIIDIYYVTLHRRDDYNNVSIEHVYIYGSHNITYLEAKNDNQRMEITYHEGF